MKDWITLILLFLAYCNDLFVSTAPLYHFELPEALRWLIDIKYMEWPYTVGCAALIVIATLATTGVAVLWSQPRDEDRKQRSVLMLLIAIVLSFFSLKQPVNTSKYNFTVQSNNHLVSYSGIRQTIDALRALSKNSHFGIDYTLLSMNEFATGRVMEAARNSNQSSLKQPIVLIIVESLGVFNDASLQKTLTPSLIKKDILQKYKVTFETIPYWGSTNYGEFRELCGIRMKHYGLLNIPECLPQYLKKTGFYTTAIHGFEGNFYDRNNWYSVLAFDEILFKPELEKLGYSKMCGKGFLGICDTSIIDLIHKRLIDSSPQNRPFIYWMTLNTHLPVSEEYVSDSKYDCDRNPVTRDNHLICLQNKGLYKLFDELSKIIADPELPKTKFIITGDHTPPFKEKTTKDLYNGSRVPAITLEPL